MNVLGTKEQAHRIALDVREQGRGPDEPGHLPRVKAIGWWVEEYGMAQVSMNLDDYTVTPPHVAFEACASRARALKVAVAGSEIVGLVPLKAILMAAEHHMRQEQLFMVDERQKVRLAIDRLGLSSVQPFVPEKRIIESTLMAAMGAALGAMVGWMTYGKRKFEEKDVTMRGLIPPLHEAMTTLIPLIDADTAAFNDYMAALGLPKDTPEQAAERNRALQAGLQKAVQVPLRVMQVADSCWDAMIDMAHHGNLASRSDLEVGARALESGIWGASRNVEINLASIEDSSFRQQMATESLALATRARERAAEVLRVLAAR